MEQGVGCKVITLPETPGQASIVQSAAQSFVPPLVATASAAYTGSSPPQSVGKSDPATDPANETS